MKFLDRIICAICTIALSACASNNFSQTRAAVEGVALKGSQLYIYSFLDIREQEFGPNMLTQLDTQLIDALEGSGVAAKLLRFRSSEGGKNFVPVSRAVSYSVAATVTGNLASERTTGTQYRLKIEPTSMIVQGAWRNYEITWTLENASTGALVWQTTLKGRHANAWRNDEDPQLRAKKIVNGIIQEMRTSKLL